VNRQWSTLLLYGDCSPAGPEKIAKWFGPWRVPGTTSIGLRKTRPELFQDTLDSPCESYENWLTRTVSGTLNALLRAQGPASGKRITDGELSAITGMVFNVLELQTPFGVPLNELIPQQMYEDAFVKVLTRLMDPSGRSSQPHLYREFNALCERIAMALIDRMAERKMSDPVGFDVERMIRISVISGHVGINLKSSASAASVLLNRTLLPLNPLWVRDLAAVREVPYPRLVDVAENLLELAGSPEGIFGLESLACYQEEVAETRDPTLLVFFSDDFLESIIDMKRFELMLSCNPRVNLLFVPRAGRYGNDMAYADILRLLNDHRLERFREHIRLERVHISAHGPRAGCIDPRHINDGLIGEIEALGAARRIILETKGCRNFEMLQGCLPIPWYASFNCNRALSIRTVGVDGYPVFLRIPPELKAYDGFDNPRIGFSPSYPSAGVRFASMTTRDLFRTLRGPAYGRMRSEAGGESAVNSRLTREALGLGITVSEVVERIAGGGQTPPDSRPGQKQEKQMVRFQ
jgi:hypothetical protein